MQQTTLKESENSHRVWLNRESPITVLLAIDGVRWQDVFLGPETSRAPQLSNWTAQSWTPQLSELRKDAAVYGGPHCASFRASGPNYVSLPGYMEMLSGCKKIACTENDCPQIQTTTLLDEFSYAKRPEDAPPALFSSWERLISGAALHADSGIVSAGRFEGRQLEILQKWPATARLLKLAHEKSGGDKDFRFDSLTAKLAIAYLRQAAPHFVFLSLGQTDEAAHDGNYLAYLQALRAADRVIGQIRRILQKAEAHGRQTLFMVTSDHGRSQSFNEHGRSFPESAESFLIVSRSLVQRKGPVTEASACLADIAPTIRYAAGLPHHYGTDQGRVMRELFDASPKV